MGELKRKVSRKGWTERPGVVVERENLESEREESEDQSGRGTLVSAVQRSYRHTLGAAGYQVGKDLANYGLSGKEKKKIFCMEPS